MNEKSLLSPEAKRPVLHRMIDSLPAEQLDLAEAVLARLEMDRIWGRLRADFAEDWADGKFSKLDTVIAEVRRDLNRREG